MNINTYLNRIEYIGTTKATLEVLNNLHTCHLLRVPFENLDIHYRTPILLDLEMIYNKIVIKKRGGFCYELNGLFFELLQNLGFNVKRVSARVYNSTKDVYGEEFDHMAIIAEINQVEYLVDVGFGEFVLTPLKLEINSIQTDSRGYFIIEKYDNEYYKVSKLVKNKKIPEYIFSKKARETEAFREMCNYHQTSSDSHFTQKRLISKLLMNGRVTISGNSIKITEEGKEVLHQQFKNHKEYADHLLEHFGLNDKAIISTTKTSF
ncbi:arylamine N-acetyltransferase [Aquimarina sp. I32.4]|uniref:arylamine N-acetyltransferase family protein n=1 Tax=Aquimarina sp. I32.4 TaxID=2053903 RepID=UPI000CDED750|nr:arylamine N-acetyltransferase [Aquimarina sp. I32.4]